MKRRTYLLGLFGVGVMTTSCVYDDPSLFDPLCGRYIELETSDGNNNQVGQAVAYVYDAQGVLVGFLPASVGVPLDLEQFRDYGKITVVVWGNASDPNAPQSLPEPTIGSSIKDHLLTQRLSNGSDGVFEPSDLFFGTLEVDFSQPPADPQAVTPLLINRVVSSLALTVRGVGGAFDGPAGNYSVVVRHPYSALDFAGNPTGSPATYRPAVRYDAATDELTSDVLVALPTGSQGVVVELYANGRLVYSTAVDSSGALIGLKPNQLQNVLVELRQQITVALVATPWGEAWIFERFD